MKKKILKQLVSWLLCLLATTALADAVVVIGHEKQPKLDALSIKKLFTGRMVEINGFPVTVVNASPGSVLRVRFLTTYLNQDDEHYVAYWTVRQFVGKGRPPRDLDSSAAIIDFVQKNPGAIGYIDAADLKPGLNVLNRQ